MFECEFTVVNFDIPATLVDTEVVVETDVDVTDTVGLVLLLNEEAELILGMRGRLDKPLSFGFKKDKTELRGLLEFLLNELDDCPLLEEFNDLEEFSPLLLPETDGEPLFRSLEYFPFELLEIPEDNRPLWDSFLSADAALSEVDDEATDLLLGKDLDPPNVGWVFAEVGVDTFPGEGVVPPALEFPEVRMDTAPILPIVVEVGVAEPGEEVGVGVLALDTAELGGMAIGFNLILGVLVMSFESSLLTLTLVMESDLWEFFSDF